MEHEPIPAGAAAHLPSGERGDARAGLTVMGEARQLGGAWTTVRVEDLSPTGFRIAWFPRGRPNQPVWLRMPSLQPLEAMVRWKRGDTAGCEFAAPLHVAVFEHLVRQAIW